MSHSLCFNDFTFSPITRGNQPWIRATELARALGYGRENQVSRLYRNNADEFTPDMTQLVEITAQPQNGAEGRARIFSLRGCHLLAMFARTPVAKAFRKWVLDVIEQYGDRVPVAEPVTLNDELISAAERAELKLIVDAKLSTYPAAVQGKARAEIWAKFNRHFRIAEYKQLPARLMPEAREFLLSVRVRAINAIPTAESAIPYPALPASSVYAAPPRRGMDRIRGGNPLPAPPIRQRALARQGEHLSRTAEPGMFPAEHLEGSASRHPTVQLVQRPDVD